MTPSLRSLSIVIPAFNEASSIEASVRDALRVGATVTASLEVVVCDDASTDDTGAILDRLAAADPRVRVFHRRRNAGIAASLAALYASARHETIFANSADQQWPMEALLPMARALAAGADLVVGTRPGKRAVYTPYRRLLSLGYQGVVRALGAPVGDPGSIKLGRAEALRIPVTARGVFAEGERLIRAARAGYRTVACDVEFTRRRAGTATGARLHVVAGVAADLVRTGLSLLLGWPPPRPPARDPDDAT